MDIQEKYTGVGRFRQPQPWYRQTTQEPWDEEKVSWLLDNKYRRLIIKSLLSGPKTKKQLSKLASKLGPRLADFPPTQTTISADALETHLDLLTWHGLIRKEKDYYHSNLPLLKRKNLKSLEPAVSEMANQLATAIAACREKILRQGKISPDQILNPLLEKVIQNTIEKLEERAELKYRWEAFHQWVEEFDADAFRSWVSQLRSQK